MLAGHAHAATQTDTEQQLGAGAAQMNSDQSKGENLFKKSAKTINKTCHYRVFWRMLKTSQMR